MPKNINLRLCLKLYFPSKKKKDCRERVLSRVDLEPKQSIDASKEEYTSRSLTVIKTQVHVLVTAICDHAISTYNLL